MGVSSGNKRACVVDVTATTLGGGENKVRVWKKMLEEGNIFLQEERHFESRAYRAGLVDPTPLSGVTVYLRRCRHHPCCPPPQRRGGRASGNVRRVLGSQDDNGLGLLISGIFSLMTMAEREAFDQKPGYFLRRQNGR